MLQQSEAKYRDLFKAARDIIIILIVDAQGNILDINPQGQVRTGYHQDQLLKMNLIHDLVVEEDRVHIQNTLQKAMDNQSDVCEVRWFSSENETVYLEGATTPQLNASGEFLTARFIFRDITERRQTERELIRIERLRSLGEMSAGISHNLNNLLTGILLPTELLQNKITDPKLLYYLDTIQKSGTRVADLVERLNESVRETEDVLSPVSVNDTIRDVIQATRPRWKDEAEANERAITVQTQLQDVPPIVGTKAGLHAVLINLIFNAIDALPQGGRIVIASKLAGDRVQIWVKDTGVGMDEYTRIRIFEPFFTTKMDVGTGLGLSTVYATITRWGGDIGVESTQGKGTTFTLELPCGFESENREIISSVENSIQGKRHILIVDDEEIIRTTLCDILKDHHHITLCDNGALAIREAQKETFDIAFIDFGLPEQRGDVVAQTLRTINPKLVIILITGWRLEQNTPQLKPFDFHLEKPFHDAATIQKVLHQALALHNKRIKRTQK